MDVKDAFLMAKQPDGERNRTAAKSWYDLLKEETLSLGGQADVMQPTLFKLEELLVSVHIDDLIMVGSKKASERYISYLREKAKWKIEVEGPFSKAGDEFSYLKRKYSLVADGCVVRADPLHIEKLAEVCPFLCWEALVLEWRKARCSVWHSRVSQNDGKAYKSQSKTCLPLGKLLGRNKELYGLKLSIQKRGKTVLDRRSAEDLEDDETHLLEVVTDADYAGCKNTRKSISCHRIFLDGNLLESKVRGQKSIALSSGESEFVAIVGGCSEAMFIRHLWHFMFGQFLRVKSRSDSSAARCMCQRQGAGRVRHLQMQECFGFNKGSNRR